jgi:hypothetical protein
MVLIWAIAWPGAVACYTVDEYFTTDQGVFLWYGLTPKNLDWPVGLSTYIFYLLWICHFLYNALSMIATIHSLADVLHLMDLTTYQYLAAPQQYLIVGRAIQVMICSWVLWQTTQKLQRYAAIWLSENDKKWLTILLVASPFLWVHLLVMRPEAIAIVLAFDVIFTLIFCQNLPSKITNRLLLVFGLCVSQRSLFLMFGIIIIGVILYECLSKKEPIKLIIKRLGYFLGGLFMGVPFIITDTLTFLKAFVGNVITKRTTGSMTGLYNTDYIASQLLDPAVWIWLVFMLIGFVVLFKITSKKYVIVFLIINLLVIAHLIFSSATITQTHILPCMILGYMAVMAGVLWLKNKIQQWLRHQTLQTIVYMSFLALLTILIILPVRDFYRLSQTKTNLQTTQEWLLTNVPNHAKVRYDAILDMTVPFDSLSINRVLNRLIMSQQNNNKAQLMFAKTGTQQQASVPIVATTFLYEDEKLMTLKYQILARFDYLTRKKFDAAYFLDQTQLSPWAMTKAEVMKDFEAKQIDWLITNEPIPNIQHFKVFYEDRGRAVWLYREPVPMNQ